MWLGVGCMVWNSREFMQVLAIGSGGGLSEIGMGFARSSRTAVYDLEFRQCVFLHYDCHRPSFFKKKKKAGVFFFGERTSFGFSTVLLANRLTLWGVFAKTHYGTACSVAMPSTFWALCPAAHLGRSVGVCALGNLVKPLKAFTPDALLLDGWRHMQAVRYGAWTAGQTWFRCVFGVGDAMS